MSSVMVPSCARYPGSAYIITCIMPKPATNKRQSAARVSRLRARSTAADVAGHAR